MDYKETLQQLAAAAEERELRLAYLFLRRLIENRKRREA